MRLLLVLAVVTAASPALGAPRVMSADYCADQHVLALADQSDIAALSRDATRDFSYLRARARGLPELRPEPEEVARARPELIVRFWGGNAAAMERMGAKVVTLDYATDFAGVAANIRKAAAALERPERGQVLIAQMQRRVAALKARPASRASALYVTPGGVTAGPGTFVDAILTTAGVVNAAAGRAGWAPLPLEALVAKPPDLLVAGFFSSASERSGNWSAIRHPAFAALFGSRPAVHLDADVVSCPAWFGLDAAEKIADAAETIDE